VREVVFVFGAGIMIGAPAAVAVSRVMKGMLFGLAAWDPVTLTGAVATLCMAGAWAGYVPARRVMRIDPSGCLRYE
jgi:ABC-type antimicrobial peptide transport system permease subunit